MTIKTKLFPYRRISLTVRYQCIDMVCFYEMWRHFEGWRSETEPHRAADTGLLSVDQLKLCNKSLFLLYPQGPKIQ